MEAKNKFTGYSNDTFKFLKSLEKNNNKQWFEKHKKDYEKFILEPTRNLVSELGDFMLDIDPRLEISPAINKTISRIYRDTRFSKDKSLYRSNFWIVFKRSNKEWSTKGCGYFFEVCKNSYRYGMGFYDAAPVIMSKFREQIDENPEEFEKTISFYSKQKTFKLEGENYKRIIDSSKPKEIQEWYQKKSMYLVCEKKIDKVLYDRRLIDELKFGFATLAPLYRYFQKIISLTTT